MMTLDGNPELNHADNKARIQACKEEYDRGIVDNATECYWHSRNVTCKECENQ